jgi:hypothetical protein
MSFGLVEADTIKTKKALREAVKERGADNVMVFDTSMHGNRGIIPLSALERVDVIVGPNVYRKRVWSANFRSGKVM